MSAILALLMRPLIEAAVSAFGHAIMDMLAAWRSHEDAKALGHAEATQAATLAAEKARDRMEDVMPMSDEEILRRLMEGKA